MKQLGQSSEIKYKIEKSHPGTQSVNKNNLTNRSCWAPCRNINRVWESTCFIFILSL